MSTNFEFQWQFPFGAEEFAIEGAAYRPWTFPNGTALGDTLATDFASSLEVEPLDTMPGYATDNWREATALPILLADEFAASIRGVEPIGAYQWLATWQAVEPDWLDWPEVEEPAEPEIVCACCNCDCSEDSGENVNEPETGPYRAEYLCDDCYSETYSSCAHCGDETEVEDAYAPECGDGYYCSRCYHELFVSCDDCDDSVSQEDSHSVYRSGRERTVCNCCYENEYFYCEGCNECLHNDEYGSDCRCEECARSDEEWDCGHFNDRNNSFVNIGSRKFGVELETSQVDNYEKLRETIFGCVEDGSISGMEFVSPPMFGDNGLAAIDDFCDAADRCEVDAKCGFHLHVDMGDCEPEQLVSVAAAYKLTEDVWRAFVSEARRDRYYCRAIDWALDDILSAGGSRYDFQRFVSTSRVEGRCSRYQWVNLEAYSKHGTFEIRLHGATLDAPKVKNWARAHTAFVDWARTQTIADLQAALTGSTAKQFAALADIWGAAGMLDLREFYHDRARQFGRDFATELASELASELAREPVLCAA